MKPRGRVLQVPPAPRLPPSPACGIWRDKLEDKVFFDIAGEAGSCRSHVAGLDGSILAIPALHRSFWAGTIRPNPTKWGLKNWFSKISSPSSQPSPPGEGETLAAPYKKLANGQSETTVSIQKNQGKSAQIQPNPSKSNQKSRGVAITERLVARKGRRRRQSG